MDATVQIQARHAELTEASCQMPHMFHLTPTARQAQSILDGIDPKYLTPNGRFGVAFYVSEQPETALAELAHYGIQAAIGIRFKLDQRAMRVLDLTVAANANDYGYMGGPISAATQAIGQRARIAGYNVIKFPSERLSGGSNYAVLDDFNRILKPVAVTPVQP